MTNKFSEGKNYKVVAVVMGGFFKSEHIRYMKLMENSAKKNNIKFVYFSTVSDFSLNGVYEEGERSVFDLIQINRFDAILLFAESYKDNFLLESFVKTANLEDVPVITVDKSLPGSSVDIKFAFEIVFRDIVKHMLEKHDFNTIYFMGGIPNNSYSESRLNIFKEEMTSHDKIFDDKSIYYGYFWAQPCITAMDQMFENIKNGLSLPDCIICANDSMAITVIDYLNQKGYKVPEDIAVSGFDGVELEEYFTPRITTGKTDYELFADSLFEVLKQNIPSDIHVEDVFVPCKLQIGCSCGCTSAIAKPAGQQIYRTDSAFFYHLKYQLDCGQIVTNSGASTTFEEAMKVVPTHLKALFTKKYWLVVNEDFANDAKYGLQDNASVYANNLKFTENMYVWDFNTTDPDYKGFSEKINYGDILPDFTSELDEEDSLLIIPIHTKGIALGYSVISFDVNEFSHAMYLTFANNFNQMIGLQYDRIHLYQIYITDSLTGLYNRSGFNKRIERVVLDNPNEEIALISVDIQKLKEINDSWGHEEGDNAIIEMSKIISSIVDDGICARIEGDQFMICVHGDDLNNTADNIIHSINHQIEHRNQFTDKYYMLNVRTNYFVSKIVNHTPDYILKKADDLLYIR